MSDDPYEEDFKRMHDELAGIGALSGPMADEAVRRLMKEYPSISLADAVRLSPDSMVALALATEGGAKSGLALGVEQSAILLAKNGHAAAASLILHFFADEIAAVKAEEAASTARAAAVEETLPSSDQPSETGPGR